MNRKQEYVVWMTALYLIFVFIVVLACGIQVQYTQKTLFDRVFPELLLFSVPAIVLGGLAVMSFRDRSK